MSHALGLGTLHKHRCCYLVFIYSFYFWLHWAFVAAHGLSSVAMSGDSSWFRCRGCMTGSLVAEHRLQACRLP